MKHGKEIQQLRQLVRRGDRDRFCCQACGRDIPLGGLFYIGRAQLISGSDGILAPSNNDPEKAIEQALKELAGKTEKEMMDEVYEEFILLLCPGCREKLGGMIRTFLQW